MTLSITQIRRLGRATAAVALTAGATVSGALVPAVADAGIYHVYTCRQPSGAPAPTDGWDLDIQVPSGYAGAGSSCATGGSLYTNFDGTIPHANTESVALRFKPIGGTVIDSAVLWRFSHNGDAGGYAVWDTNIAAPGPVYGGDVIENLYGAGQYGTGDTPLHPSNRFVIGKDRLGTPGATINIATFCATQGGYPCNGSAGANLYAADISMLDTSQPYAVTASGDLVKDGAISGQLSGTKTAVVQANDLGVGLFRAYVEVDGAVAAEGRVPDPAGRCAPIAAAGGTRGFLYRQPCPLSGAASVSWDTTKVPDGEHTVRVLMEDASGNITAAAAGNVLVKNASQVGPGSPLVFRGETNGSVATDTAQLLAGIDVKAPKSCKRKTFAKKHPVACSGRRRVIGRSYSSKLTDRVSGRLQTPDGSPIGGAAIAVTGVPRGNTPGSVALGSATTDANGGWAIDVPRNLSMDVVASWNARKGDTVAAASQAVGLRIRATTTLRAPKHSRAGKRATFKGTLISRGAAGIAVPARIPIQVQVRYGGRWSTLGTALTDENGVWSLRYRWPKSLRGSGRVRAQVKAATGFAYEPGKSKSRSIRVTG